MQTVFTLCFPTTSLLRPRLGMLGIGVETCGVVTITQNRNNDAVRLSESNREAALSSPATQSQAVHSQSQIAKSQQSPSTMSSLLARFTHSQSRSTESDADKKEENKDKNTEKGGAPASPGTKEVAAIMASLGSCRYKETPINNLTVRFDIFNQHNNIVTSDEWLTLMATSEIERFCFKKTLADCKFDAAFFEARPMNKVSSKSVQFSFILRKFSILAASQDKGADRLKFAEHLKVLNHEKAVHFLGTGNDVRNEGWSSSRRTVSEQPEVVLILTIA